MVALRGSQPPRWSPVTLIWVPTPLCGPLTLNRADYVTAVSQRERECDLPEPLTKRLRFPLAPSGVTYSGGHWTSYHEEVHVGRIWASCHQPTSSDLLREWAILDMDPPAPVKPSDDCNSGGHLDCSLTEATPRFLTYRNCVDRCLLF